MWVFGQKHYTFSAPIDYDKFLNYENYYWYPSLDLNVPAIIISGLVESFESVANSKTFVLTYPIAPNDIVEVNGVATSDYEATGLSLSFATSSINVVTGDKITVNHRVDPNNIIGSKSYTSPNGVKLSSGMLIQFSDNSLVGTAYKDKKVFVDLKFFDVPETVGRTISRLSDYGATFATIHGNQALMEKAAENKENLKILVSRSYVKANRIEEQ